MYHLKPSFFGTALPVLFASCLFSYTAQAGFWASSAAAATPQFIAGDGATSSTVHNSIYGTGVTGHARCENEEEINFRCLGVSRLYVAVDAPRGNNVSNIWLRAYDTSNNGYITATLYSQEIGANARRALGSVSTRNSGESGIQLVVADLRDYANSGTPTTLGGFQYTYYIELAIYRPQFELQDPSDPLPSLVAFDVGLDVDKLCHPLHPNYPGCHF
jgi:hypothetical protein